MPRYTMDPAERSNQKRDFQAYDVVDQQGHPKPRTIAPGIKKADAELIVAALNKAA